MTILECIQRTSLAISFEDFNMDAGTKPDAPKTYWERWAMNSYFLRFRLYIQGSLLRYNYWSL